MSAIPRWTRGLGGSADAVFLVDAGRKILLWNTCAEQSLGYRAAEVVGRRCCDVLEGRTCDGKAWCHSNCPVQRAVARGALHKNFDLLVRTKQGRELCLNVSVITIPHWRKHLTLHIARPLACRDRSKEALDRIRDVLRDSGALSESSNRSDGGDGADPDDSGSLSRLTAREIEILSLVAQGLPNAAIANRLCVSSFTVRNHVQNILEKLGLHSKAQAVGFAFKRHLLQ
jgi:PAS domain S-box-containing protein